MPQEQHLRSEAVQDILTKVPNWTIRYGNTILFLLLLIFLSFSWFIRYPDVVSSQALLTSEIPPQKEIAQRPGKITHLFVTNGEQVNQGQHLAVIENTANYSDVQYLKALLDTITYTKQAFHFPIDTVPLLFLGEIDGAYANFENAYLLYDHNTRLTPFENTKTAQRFTAKELKYRLETLRNQQELQRSELSFEKKDLERMGGLFQKGVISLQEYEQKQLRYLQSERSFKNLSSSISQTRENITSSHSNYQIEESNNINEEIRLLRNTIQSFNQLKKAIYDWERQYMFRSEVVGEVSFMTYWSVNQEVQAGDVLFTIVPKDNQGHVAKLKVPALNSGKVTPGQKVLLSLTNYPETEYGKIESEVSEISNIPDPEGNYIIDVNLPVDLITTYGKAIVFQSEMTGNAEVITEDLRLLERFFYQIRGMFNG